MYPLVGGRPAHATMARAVISSGGYSLLTCPGPLMSTSAARKYNMLLSVLAPLPPLLLERQPIGSAVLRTYMPCTPALPMFSAYTAAAERSVKRSPRVVGQKPPTQSSPSGVLPNRYSRASNVSLFTCYSSLSIAMKRELRAGPSRGSGSHFMVEYRNWLQSVH